jgi:predicted HD superfamily hydrolase involved in NAD metabolism
MTVSSQASELGVHALPVSLSPLYSQVCAAMSQRRFHHCLGVTHTAALLAHRHGLDVMRTALAALLHDFRKEHHPAALAAELREANWNLWPLDDNFRKVFHAWAGEVALQRVFGIHDAEVAEAIRYHPTGHPDMGPMAMVVFLADYIEPGRGARPNLAAIRQLAHENLQAAVLMTLREKTQYLSGKEAAIVHPWSIAACAHFERAVAAAGVA